MEQEVNQVSEETKKPTTQELIKEYVGNLSSQQRIELMMLANSTWDKKENYFIHLTNCVSFIIFGYGK